MQDIQGLFPAVAADINEQVISRKNPSCKLQMQKELLSLKGKGGEGDSPFSDLDVSPPALLLSGNHYVFVAM
jgi:hypothetical protein